MADRIEVDAVTGERKVVPLTQAELDAATAAHAAELTAQAAKATDEADLTKFDRRTMILVKWIAQLHAKTPAQARAELKTIGDATP